MASTWGDSWSVAWGVSWDISDTPPVEIVAGKMLKGQLFKPKTADAYRLWYPEDHNKQIHKSATILARSGGHARAQSLTATQRSNIASKAANARWK
jgi:hypothetical protein